MKYRHEEGNLLLDAAIFQQLVGSLNYLTIIFPDISFVVQQASQFMQAPRHIHLVAIHCIIRGSDWQGCPDTHHSVTSWCMFLGQSLISQNSKKKVRVSKSSAEAEYRSMSTTCIEVVLLHGLLVEIGFPQSNPSPLYDDNTSDIQIATNLIYHKRTKHIEVDCYYMREVIDNRAITLYWVLARCE
ncbi:uncharacterized mitochondrial protein AtMg00810-like [Solanum tuberosum]|uniref:uncharacterized mitochondrial protein AtMg00810-like n=1 Tax=Solanum tuberosum TaxID=4113 RepID=UPI00073A0171|nr:PREDICTED: uncharacterized mitochondrial protein AtMg00810-like [Solanum tuberosum]